ncbi:MAG: cytochrome c biogenesis CcdA family protein [Hyphomicrobium sp.]
MTASFGLAFLAGLFSTLSPCVLPLLPVILGAAVSESKYGPVALAAGLALSFVAIGLFFALAGHAIGLDQAALRKFAGILLIVLGATLALPQFSEKFATAASPVSGWAEARFGAISTSGLQGQFALGLLLGAVWSPCVGPTLGAASVLAAQGENLVQVASIMALFGVGAALPLLGLGLLSREAMLKWRNRLMGAGKSGKAGLGVLLALIGVMVLSGLDKHLEAALVAASPQWLTDLTTRF